MDNSARIAAMRAALENAFAPQRLDIHDDSHHHAGHSSHGGAGHFRVEIVADAFAGKNRVERHQMVFAALAALIGKDIHALGIRAQTLEETEKS
ncbi:MAG: BolA family protein [Cardiobacteriaceae bacterium]|nr:BolA family protein [Cardiobacteriaceae bacterium]